MELSKLPPNLFTDFAKGAPFTFSCKDLSCPPHRLIFEVAKAGNFLLEAGGGAGVGEFDFTLVNKGTAAAVAAEEKGILSPALLEVGIYVLEVKLNTQLPTVIERAKKKPATLASGSYALKLVP